MSEFPKCEHGIGDPNNLVTCKDCELADLRQRLAETAALSEFRQGELERAEAERDEANETARFCRAKLADAESRCRQMADEAVAFEHERDEARAAARLLCGLLEDPTRHFTVAGLLEKWPWLSNPYQEEPHCTCHDRDGSYTRDFCHSQGIYGHLEQPLSRGTEP